MLMLICLAWQILRRALIELIDLELAELSVKPAIDVTVIRRAVALLPERKLHWGQMISVGEVRTSTEESDVVSKTCVICSTRHIVQIRLLLNTHRLSRMRDEMQMDI